MAAKKIYVRPAPGRSFPHAAGSLRADRMVRPEGEMVPAVSYYLRGLRSGDLIEGKPKPKAKAKKKAAPKPKPMPAPEPEASTEDTKE